MTHAEAIATPPRLGSGRLAMTHAEDIATPRCALGRRLPSAGLGEARKDIGREGRWKLETGTALSVIERCRLEESAGARPFD